MFYRILFCSNESNQDDVEDVNFNFDKFGIPMDVIWLDIGTSSFLKLLFLVAHSVIRTY